MQESYDELQGKGVQLLMARPKRHMSLLAQRSGIIDHVGRHHIFPSIRSAVIHATESGQSGSKEPTVSFIAADPDAP